MLIAVIPSALLFAIHPVLGIAVGVPLVAIAIGTVQALEGIFKAALYDFARGEQPQGFDRGTLEGRVPSAVAPRRRAAHLRPSARFSSLALLGCRVSPTA